MIRHAEAFSHPILAEATAECKEFRDSLRTGYRHARSPAFYAQPLVRSLEWARLPGDVLFIVGGILPIVYLALRTFYYRNRPVAVAAEEPSGAFVTKPS